MTALLTWVKGPDGLWHAARRRRVAWFEVLCPLGRVSLGGEQSFSVKHARKDTCLGCRTHPELPEVQR